jgi:hypothetical protein
MTKRGTARGMSEMESRARKIRMVSVAIAALRAETSRAPPRLPNPKRWLAFSGKFAIFPGSVRETGRIIQVNLRSNLSNYGNSKRSSPWHGDQL